MPPTAAPAPPGRPNYYNDEDFVRPDPARGTLRDAAGRRLVCASADLLAALTAAVEAENGATAGDVFYDLGRRWGEADFRAFADRAPREFGVPSLEQMHFNVMLESWRWPLTAAGWGTWRYDFRRARAGLPVVELANSAVVAAVGRTGKPACDLYAGLFAAVFSSLARRELAGVELQCAAAGADGCRILVASSAKAAAAAKLRDEGLSAEEILDRLVPPPAAEPGKEPGA
ncbi:MAG TPA: V4R domain-containing protein [Gemmataceae bacterium]|jgi:predicted hydrocarbon binding protein